MMRVLLAIDGDKTAKDLEKECNLYQVKCWRILDSLQREGVIYKLETTKRNSPVYAKQRWYKVLRLDEIVREKLDSKNPQSALGQATATPDQTRPTQDSSNVQQESIQDKA